MKNTNENTTKIKFLMHAVKFDNKRVRVWYSKGGYTEASGLAEDTITIYAKQYKHLPKELNPENNTDTQADYFESDKARITKDSPYYKEVNEAYLKAEAKRRFN